MTNVPDGLVLVNKPEGITSFQTLTVIKTRLKTRKVGHTGTLDKFAAGLLPVLTGRMTRLAPVFNDLDKSYLATVILGEQTDTLDPEGTVIDRKEIPEFSQIESAIRSLTGEIDQLPPAYSAVHIGGRRAYRLARSGLIPILKPRRVIVRRLEVIEYDPPQLLMRVDCSKGTYIRSLARDLGREAGSCAFVSSLIRTRVGRFRIEDAVSPDDFDPANNLRPAFEFLQDIDRIKAATLKEDHVPKAGQGSPLTDNFFLESSLSDGSYAIFDRLHNLVALAFREKGRFKYRAVLMRKEE